MQPVSHVKKKLDDKKIAALLKPPPTASELVAAIRDGVTIEYKEKYAGFSLFLGPDRVFKIFLPSNTEAIRLAGGDLNVKSNESALWFELLRIHLCRKVGHVVSVKSWIVDVHPPRSYWSKVYHPLMEALKDPEKRDQHLATVLEIEAQENKRLDEEAVALATPGQTPSERLAQEITTVDLMQYGAGVRGMKLKWTGGSPECCWNNPPFINVRSGSSREETRKAIWSFIAHRYVLEFMLKLIPKLNQKACLETYHKEIEQLAALWDEKEPPILRRYTTRLSL
jgi:hypothetical protein